MLCICETKLDIKHLETLKTLIKRYKLSYRISYVDNKASRGVMIVWDTITFPFQVQKAYVDHTNKRAVSVRMKGGKGTTLTVTCGQFEKVTPPP